MTQGIDEGRLTPWLADRLPELEPPFQFVRVGEGQSNLTFRVEDAAGRAVVLRRPPLGEILASAHDMDREHRILTGLAGAGARVPRPVAACDDPEGTGAPLYVMEHVDGVILTQVKAAAELAPPPGAQESVLPRAQVPGAPGCRWGGGLAAEAARGSACALGALQFWTALAYRRTGFSA